MQPLFDAPPIKTQALEPPCFLVFSHVIIALSLDQNYIQRAGFPAKTVSIFGGMACFIRVRGRKMSPE
ncbi:hypothetical protein [Brucella inopinata]|uniref:Uncharacterized protein n=1 Tax=Brucella inopinata TaxID=1218315 RepID=A0AAW7B223_9HYPH|nr:hypothetical protein [Brucella inopinata]EFM56600.1 Hypothetical protein BIBO1_1334 [Brucella inopinata BO1]MDL2331830.1 hypothetical protein [Brucella inopinata]